MQLFLDTAMPTGDTQVTYRQKEKLSLFQIESEASCLRLGSSLMLITALQSSWRVNRQDFAMPYSI